MLTAEQRELRRAFVGSSDAPAVCGVDPYRSAADIYLSKVGELEDGGNDATEAGNLLERAVLDWAERQIGCPPLARDQFLSGRTGPLCANLDGVDIYSHAVVEAKTTGITGPPDPGFGAVTEGPAVELPERVLCQVAHQLYVAGPAYRLAWVPVLIGGAGFRLYRVDRSDELCEAVAARCVAFWRDHVQTRTPPDDFKPSIEVLKRLRREPGKVVDVADELVDAWTVARAARLKADEEESAAQAALIAAIRDGDAARFSRGLVTYHPVNRKGYTVEPMTYRTLRCKTNRKDG